MQFYVLYISNIYCHHSDNLGLKLYLWKTCLENTLQKYNKLKSRCQKRNNSTNDQPHGWWVTPLPAEPHLLHQKTAMSFTTSQSILCCYIQFCSSVYLQRWAANVRKKTSVSNVNNHIILEYEYFFSTLNI